MSRGGGGVIRLLDQLKTYPFPNFSLRQILAILAQVKQSSHNSSKHAKSIWAAESKACNMQESKWGEFGGSKRNIDTEIFGMVLIGGAIVHPR